MAYSGDSSSSLRADWDPTCDDYEPISDRAIRRIKSDLGNLQAENCWGIFAEPDENNISKVNLLIIGPENTPYYGGFFHFLVVFSSSYPTQPPKVKIMNTDGGRVRFNPNLYANGKVCLSIIGTWPGPSWTPTMNLMTIAVSIQSLMGDEPLFNEPGVYKDDTRMESSHLSDKYNAQIRHEVLRVAVIQFVKYYTQSVGVPSSFRTSALEMFAEFYQAYIDSCDTYEASYRRAESTMEVRVPRGIFSTMRIDFPHMKKELVSTAEEFAPGCMNRRLTEQCDSDREESVRSERSSSTTSLASDNLILASPDEN